MASPVPSNAEPRGDLALTIEQFDLEANNSALIALELFPEFDAKLQAANYGKIPTEQLLQEQDDTRGSDGHYNRGEFEFTSAFYATSEHGWEEPVDDRLKNMYARYFDAEVVATKRARSVVVGNHANRVYKKVLDTAVITNNAAAAHVWSDHANATPVDDVQTAMIAFRATCGMFPNTLALEMEDSIGFCEAADLPLN